MSASTAKRIAGYEVLRELGQGGMGTLYLATQPVLQRAAVLKVLHDALCGDPVQEERFLREAQTAARIHHPNVVAVYDCFTFRGETYLAQEYVDGLDLASLGVRCGPLPARVAALIALEVARGLEEIHAQGIVHRDLKPANVLLSRRGEVKIADFGIALPDHAPALTRIGCAIGTAPYMAPEQLLGDRVDERSDSFAFGLLLYELLTAQRPFAADDAEPEASLLRSIQRGRYIRPGRRAPRTPQWLARAIRACLRAKPARRPLARDIRREFEHRVYSPEAAACRTELATWLAESGALAAPAELDPAATRVKPAAPPPRPRRRWVAVAATALLLASALAGLFLIRTRPTLPPRWSPLTAPATPEKTTRTRTPTPPAAERTPAEKPEPTRAASKAPPKTEVPTASKATKPAKRPTQPAPAPRPGSRPKKPDPDHTRRR